MCNMYLGLSLFHGTHERRENCMYVRQVLNGVSDGTQGMFMYASVCVCVCVCACLPYESFYWCAHCTPGP